MDEVKKEPVKKPEIKKRKKYVGKSIHIFFVDGKKRKLEPGKIIPEDILNSAEVKRLIKDKKVVEL